MTRRAILQIGTEKTGTTTLQKFLAANREKLTERGFVYPTFCGAFNHSGLAAYGMNDGRRDELRRAFGGQTAELVPAMRDRMRNAARQELDNDLTAIFCSEHCHSRLVKPEEVQRLHAFLSEFFDEVHVSVYLRRQDRIALSLYSTKLKSGGAPDRILPSPSVEDPYYNYDKFLTLWEHAFGRDAIRVRLFETDQLVGGSVVDDFLHTWNIGAPSEFHSVANANSSINGVAQEFLRLINPLLRPEEDQSLEHYRGPMVDAISGAFSGRGPRPSRAEARAFYETYATSNATVAARHFPDRETLFTEDFDKYPEVEDPRICSREALMGVAATLLKERTERIQRLEAEIAIRDAHILWHEDKTEAALQKVITASNRWPRYAGLHRTRAEFLFRLKRFDESATVMDQAIQFAPQNQEFRNFLGFIRSRQEQAENVKAPNRNVAAPEPVR